MGQMGQWDEPRARRQRIVPEDGRRSLNSLPSRGETGEAKPPPRSSHHGPPPLRKVLSTIRLVASSLCTKLDLLDFSWLVLSWSGPDLCFVARAQYVVACYSLGSSAARVHISGIQMSPNYFCASIQSRILAKFSDRRGECRSSGFRATLMSIMMMPCLDVQQRTNPSRDDIAYSMYKLHS